MPRRLLITPRGGRRSEPGRACGASSMLSRTRPGHYHQLRTTPKGSGISPVPRLSAPTALLLSPFIHSSTSSRGWALRGGSGCCGGVWWSCGGSVDEWRQQHSCGGVVVELHGCSGRALNAVHASRPLRDPGSRGWAAGDSQLIDGHGERLAHLDGPRPDLCVRRSEAETEREHQSVGRAVGMQTCSPFNTSREEDLDTRRRNGNALIDTDRRRDGSCTMLEDGAPCWRGNFGCPPFNPHQK